MLSKLTANSVVFLILTLFSVGVAFAFRHPLLVYTAVFLITTNVVLFAWSQRSTDRMVVKRRLPRMAVAGSATEVTIELTNDGSAPRFGLMGYDLHGQMTPGSEYSPVAFLTAPPGERVETTYTMVPQRSGVYPVGPFYLYAGDPFGFYKNWRRVQDSAELVVLPNPVSFRLPRQNSASLLALDELETVPIPGESTEFIGVREYRAGEPLKRVHWPTSARLGRLISRQFELNVSASISALLLLDQQMLRGGFADNPKEYALRMIAGLARGTITDNYNFSYLGVTGTETESLSGSGYTFYQQLALHLARLTSAAPPAWEKVSRYILHYLPKRSSLIVFMSSIDDEARIWLRQMAVHFSGLSVVCFNRQSFDRAQRQGDDLPATRVEEGYVVHEVFYRSDLSRVLGRVLARTRIGGGQA